MIKYIRNIEKSIGNREKKISKSELSNKTIVRKSIFAKQDIKKGELFSWSNLCIKRPGNGVSPMLIDKYLGKNPNLIIKLMIKLNNKICVFSSSRADYGLLRPVIKKINDDKKLNLKLLISGTHLKKNFGNTILEIKKDKFKYNEINFPNSLLKTNILKTNYLKKINEYFEKPNQKF